MAGEAKPPAAAPGAKVRQLGGVYLCSGGGWYCTLGHHDVDEALELEVGPRAPTGSVFACHPCLGKAFGRNYDGGPREHVGGIWEPVGEREDT